MQRNIKAAASFGKVHLERVNKDRQRRNLKTVEAREDKSVANSDTRSHHSFMIKPARTNAHTLNNTSA